MGDETTDARTIAAIASVLGGRHRPDSVDLNMAAQCVDALAAAGLEVVARGTVPPWMERVTDRGDELWLNDRSHRPGYWHEGYPPAGDHFVPLYRLRTEEDDRG